MKSLCVNHVGKNGCGPVIQSGSGDFLFSPAPERTCGADLELDGKSLRNFLLSLVAIAFDAPIKSLLGASRGPARIALARQVAMYLAHTALGISLSAVGRIFRRDRTTVAHGCALVEDARDREDFDHVLLRLERAINLHMEMMSAMASARGGAGDEAMGGET
jgi:hypothetical protein